MDNLRYFKFVGNERQGNAYGYKVVQGNIYPSDFMVSSRSNVLDCSTAIGFYEAEWQEVYVSDVEPESKTPIKTAIRNACEKLAELEEKYSNNLPQKTFPLDAVTLDTYEGGNWYDVREVLPDERYKGNLFVRLSCNTVRLTVWDNEDEKFISRTGDTLDTVMQWRANILGK